MTEVVDHRSPERVFIRGGVLFDSNDLLVTRKMGLKVTNIAGEDMTAITLHAQQASGAQDSNVLAKGLLSWDGIGFKLIARLLHPVNEQKADCARMNLTTRETIF